MSGTDSADEGELLEFLGSIDQEGEGWSEYLEDTDVSRPRQPPAAPPAAPPSQAPPRAPQPESQP